MHIFPEILTLRLKLRKIQPEDIPNLIKYANNKKISDNIINIPHPYREPDAILRISYVVQGFKKRSRYVFSITLKSNEEFIGEISLHIDSNNDAAELGFWIGDPFWGNGYVSEAITTVLEFGFTKLNLTKIYASCHPSNMASQKVLLKNRMQTINSNMKIIEFVANKENYLNSSIL